MQTKENPGLGAGVRGYTPHEGRNDTPAIVAPAPLWGCPRLLASQQFPARAFAIRRASDRRELVRASAAFAFAALFVRHVSGTMTDLTHEAIVAEVESQARLSKVRGRMPARYVDDLVNAADDAARKAAGSIL